MSEYKYPYIPKEYFKAVMYACKLIREYRTFNVAVRTAASYYGVNEDEVAKHVKARSAAGNRAKKQGCKMKWFVIERSCHCDAVYEYGTAVFVTKGKSRDTVGERFAVFDLEEQRREDYGGSYAPYWTTSVISEHDTKEEAKAAAEKYRKEGCKCTTY